MASPAEEYARAYLNRRKLLEAKIKKALEGVKIEIDHKGFYESEIPFQLSHMNIAELLSIVLKKE